MAELISGGSNCNETVVASPVVPVCTIIQSDDKGGYRAPVLVSCGASSVLFDGGFTYSHAVEIIDAVRRSRTKLQAIFITHADPDYYFNLKKVTDAFQGVSVVAPPKVVERISNTAAEKLSYWASELKGDGPAAFDDIVVPAVHSDRFIQVGEVEVEIIESSNMKDWYLCWIPSIRAIIGGFHLYNGLHVWLADTPTQKERGAWMMDLAELSTLHPDMVIPSHRSPYVHNDLESIDFTYQYLHEFESALSVAKGSAELVNEMKVRFPEALDWMSIRLGAEVIYEGKAWK
jgi:metal-dependent hydrolase (beta-lactamase superfamily II)